MPHGKPANTRCVQLTDDARCLLFGKPERPAVCRTLQPSLEMCGRTAEEAHSYFLHLDLLTRPSSP